MKGGCAIKRECQVYIKEVAMHKMTIYPSSTWVPLKNYPHWSPSYTWVDIIIFYYILRLSETLDRLLLTMPIHQVSTVDTWNGMRDKRTIRHNTITNHTRQILELGIGQRLNFQNWIAQRTNKWQIMFAILTTSLSRLSCGSPLSSPSPSSRKLGRKTDRSMSICHALPGSLAASPALPR